MEINYGSLGVTMVKQSLLTCTGGDAALVSLLVSALVKIQHLFLIQEYMKLLTMQPKMRGDHHTCCPCKAIDADDDGENEDEDGDGEAEEDLSYEDKLIPTLDSFDIKWGKTDVYNRVLKKRLKILETAKMEKLQEELS
ncbi:Ubiquitinyl hydrolase 1 [Forsythia ovata]|uniref:Ubiquitinyl hydrolase 1 n=1 Tax=Forsythia ovata TaxID=205694 RepID=A0ABD1U9E2_9LAMI